MGGCPTSVALRHATRLGNHKGCSRLSLFMILPGFRDNNLPFRIQYLTEQTSHIHTRYYCTGKREAPIHA